MAEDWDARLFNCGELIELLLLVAIDFLLVFDFSEWLLVAIDFLLVFDFSDVFDFSEWTDSTFALLFTSSSTLPSSESDKDEADLIDVSAATIPF